MHELAATILESKIDKAGCMYGRSSSDAMCACLEAVCKGCHGADLGVLSAEQKAEIDWCMGLARKCIRYFVVI
jgi:hypothetical protein